MKISYYTISSFWYSGITRMLLDSFLKNVSASDIFVLCLDNNIQNIIQNPRIHYINCENLIELNLKEVKNNIINIYSSRSSLWLKSQVIKYFDDSLFDILVYIDSDSLIFQDPVDLIKESMEQSSDTLYIASDMHQKYGTNHSRINAGFWFCDPKHYPCKDLMQMVSDNIIQIYSNPNLRRTDKVLWKYVDQPSIHRIITTEMKFQKYKILSPHLITIKYRGASSLLTHYFSKHIDSMQKDYQRYITVS